MFHIKTAVALSNACYNKDSWEMLEKTLACNDQSTSIKKKDDVRNFCKDAISQFQKTQKNNEYLAQMLASSANKESSQALSTLSSKADIEKMTSQCVTLLTDTNFCKEMAALKAKLQPCQAR